MAMTLDRIRQLIDHLEDLSGQVPEPGGPSEPWQGQVVAVVGECFDAKTGELKPLVQSLVPIARLAMFKEALRKLWDKAGRYTSVNNPEIRNELANVLLVLREVWDLEVEHVPQPGAVRRDRAAPSMRDDLARLSSFLLTRLSENGGDVATSFSSAEVAGALGWDAPRFNRSMNALDKRGWLDVEPGLGATPFAAHGFEVTEDGLLGLEDAELDTRAHAPDTSSVNARETDKRLVFIIHGRNVAARNAVEQFVRCLGLEPLDFDQVASDLGGSPFVGEVVRKGLELAHGIIALFTPDEFSALDHAWRADGDKPEDVQRWQSRPNVIFEAGMAFGMSRQRTVLVTLGRQVSLFSDVSGVHTLRLDNNVESRKKLRQRLIGMGCAVNERADSWTDRARSGDFETCIGRLSEVSPRDPFADAAASPVRPAAVPREAGLSEDARKYMLALGRAYVDAGHPNHKVWQFDRGVETPVHGELLNGFKLIKLMGTRGAPYTLTDRGHAWIMTHKDGE